RRHTTVSSARELISSLTSKSTFSPLLLVATSLSPTLTTESSLSTLFQEKSSNPTKSRSSRAKVCQSTSVHSTKETSTSSSKSSSLNLTGLPRRNSRLWKASCHHVLLFLQLLERRLRKLFCHLLTQCKRDGHTVQTWMRTMMMSMVTDTEDQECSVLSS
ncbi:hypothetical protein HDU99_007578, partial [Rhizoclosmatium hyalinum]